MAVKDLNLEIEDHDFVILLGPSGCGKSTTLEIIAGLEQQTSGHVYFDDKPVDWVPPNKRNVAMVFQSYALYPNMTVAENIGFSLKLRKVPPGEIAERVKKIATMLGIGDLLHRKSRELSGGQRQRVALGRALIRNPGVFLLDEPLSNIDAKLRANMRLEIKKLHQEIKTTFIYVSHDQQEAMTMGNKIAVLNEGELLQYDTPFEIYNRPVNLFVAGFIGSPSMNMIPGKIREIHPHLFFEGENLKITLTESQKEALLKRKKTEEVIFGIRPEDISLFREKGSGNEFLPAVVNVIEPVGKENIVEVLVHSTPFVLYTTPEFPLRVGDTVYLTLNKTRSHLFDKETGIAIR
ncbi:MAG TPA: ABC transporter ATP-binding protein [Candidatus Limnocylindrales bacterium]|nr:ABC transporter ATP-binding protein [Candidatus Limnocylindrales bacterium]